MTGWHPLVPAERHSLHEGLLREKLCAFGETDFTLRTLTVDLEGALALPPSELKRMRRSLTDALSRQGPPQSQRHVTVGHAPDEVVPRLQRADDRSEPRLIPLLRTLEQLRKGDWEWRDENGEALVPAPTPETKVPALASVYALSKLDQERLCLMIGRAYNIPRL